MYSKYRGGGNDRVKYDDVAGLGRPRVALVLANRRGFGGEIGCEPALRRRYDAGGVLGGWVGYGSIGQYTCP